METSHPVYRSGGVRGGVSGRRCVYSPEEERGKDRVRYRNSETGYPSNVPYLLISVVTSIS